MEHFSLDKWLKDKSRKVVTRDGRTVRIICWDAKSSKPIVALVSTRSIDQRQFDELPISYFNDGTYYGGAKDDFLDLFFADEELTEFEKEVAEAYEWAKTTEREDFVNEFTPKLLDLARKEIHSEENSNFKPKFTYNETSYSELANKLIEFRNNTPLCSVSYRDGEGRKIILHYEKEILELVKKEILKNLPKWKKMPNGIQGNGDFNPTYLVRVPNGHYFTTPCISWDKDDMYIELSELEKLPKEE